MINKEDAILNFSKKINNRKNNNSSISSNKKLNKSDLSMLIQKVKKYGFKEIDEYKKLSNDFLTFIEESALFNGLTDEMKYYFNIYLDIVIMPLFKGDNNMNITDSTFKELRLELFKSLIKKYKDKEEIKE